MPPAGAGKAKEAKKARRVAVDSSDEEGTDCPAARAMHVRRPKPPFSKQAIFDAVLGTAAYSVRSHVPSFVSPPEVQKDWTQWLNSTAQTLAAVPTSARALPIRMPTKCIAAPVQQPSDGTTVVQRDLILYRNPDGGAARTALPIPRDDLGRVVLSDVSNGVYRTVYRVSCLTTGYVRTHPYAR